MSYGGGQYGTEVSRGTEYRAGRRLAWYGVRHKVVSFPFQHPRLKKWDTGVLTEVLQLRKARDMTVAETRRELRRRGFVVGQKCLKNKLQQIDAEEKLATVQRTTIEQTVTAASVDLTRRTLPFSVTVSMPFFTARQEGGGG